MVRTIFGKHLESDPKFAHSRTKNLCTKYIFVILQGRGTGSNSFFFDQHFFPFSIFPFLLFLLFCTLQAAGMMLEFVHKRDIRVFKRQIPYLVQAMVLADRWQVPSVISALIVALRGKSYAHEVVASVEEWVRFTKLPVGVQLQLYAVGVALQHVSAVLMHLLYLEFIPTLFAYAISYSLGLQVCQKPTCLKHRGECSVAQELQHDLYTKILVQYFATNWALLFVKYNPHVGLLCEASDKHNHVCFSK